MIQNENKSKVITITSGKGGVGKTTTAVSLGIGLAMNNKKVVVIDFDVGLKKLDLLMGCETQTSYNIIDVINGKAILEQALVHGLYKEKCGNNLSLLPTSNDHDKTALRDVGVRKIIEQLKNMNYDYIICDSPAGIENGAIHALTYADEAIIVINPEIQSIRDGTKMIAEIQKYSKKSNSKSNEKVKKHLLITKYNEKLVRQQASVNERDIINVVENDSYLGTITDSSYDTLTASNTGTPVILLKNPKSNIVHDYNRAVQILLGNTTYIPRKQGLFGRIFGL